jgi:hypothetical protein
MEKVKKVRIYGIKLVENPWAYLALDDRKLFK